MRSLAVVIVLFLGVAEAETVVITHEFMEGVVTLRVDDELVNVPVLRRYLVVHPRGYDFHYHVVPGLSLCVEGQPGYKPCGTRDIYAENYFDNAAYNLELVKERLAYLDGLKEFPELQPLVDYFRSSLRFGLWMYQRLVAYHRSWNPFQLEHDYEVLPVVNETKDILDTLKKTTDTDSRWRLSIYEWAKVANGLYRDQEGPIPKDVWMRFLEEQKIVESVVLEEFD